MPTLLDVLLEQTFAAALEAEIGIIIRIQPRDANVTAPTAKAKAMLYRFRREVANPEYKSIMIALDPTDPDRCLWLIRRSRLPESFQEEESP